MLCVHREWKKIGNKKKLKCETCYYFGSRINIKSDLKKRKTKRKVRRNQFYLFVLGRKWKTNEIPRQKRETMWKRKKHLILLVILHLWLIGTFEVEARVDICSSLCRCVNESLFVKIHCDFVDNKVSHCEIFFLSRSFLFYSAHEFCSGKLCLFATAHAHFIPSMLDSHS